MQFSAWLFCVLMMAFIGCSTKSANDPGLVEVTTKYGIWIKPVETPSFDSVVVNLEIDGVASKRVFDSATRDAQGKIRYDIVADETKVVKVHAVVWNKGRVEGTQDEVFTAGQAPQIPNVVLAPIVEFADTILNSASGGGAHIAVSATVRSLASEAVVTSLAFDWQADGTWDTTLVGSSVSFGHQFGLPANAFQNCLVQITDGLGRQLVYGFVVKSTDLFMDARDWQFYKVVVIGSQTWMAQNLNYAVVNGAWWCYENSETNCATYGRLYNYATALTACPSGWHLPDTTAWNTLEAMAGGSAFAGTKLKAHSVFWSVNSGTDDFGFSALPGGNSAQGPLYSSYLFNYLGSYAHFWTGTIYGSSGGAWYRLMGTRNASVVSDYTIDYSKAYGFSVRCLKD
jgi:uncharacterized protein (TIGR02145 family)